MQQSSFSQRERTAIAIATLAFIGISSLAHLAIGGYLEAHLPHWSATSPDQTPFILGVGSIEKIKPTPAPTPTSTPPPLHARPDTKPTRDARRQPRQPSMKAPFDRSTPWPGASEIPQPLPQSSAGPPAVGTPEPIATGVPTEAAPQPASPATFKHKVVPDYPPLCANEGAAGSVTVEVTIDSDGSLAAAWVGQTSGFACLDAAALAAAKESTYNPPEVGTRPVAETYLILYEFSIDS